MMGRWGISTRDHQVRLLECSASGCLLETRTPMTPGTTGSLRISLNHRRYFEHVQIVRCQLIAGPLVYHVAARFLSTLTPGRAPLRFALRGAPAPSAEKALRGRHKSGPVKPSLRTRTSSARRRHR